MMAMKIPVSRFWFQGWAPSLRVSALGSISGFPVWDSGLDLKTRHSGFRFRFPVSGLGFLPASLDFGFRFPVSGFPVLDSGLDLKTRNSGFRFPVFRFRVPVWTSKPELLVSGFQFPVSN